MKRLALPLAALAATACGDLDVFDVPVDGVLTIPGDPLGAQLPIVDEVPFQGLTNRSFREAFAKEGVSIDDVESIRLTSLRISVQQPEGAPLDFMQAITFSIEAEGRERRQIAHLDPVPRGVDVIELETDSVNLKPWIQADGMEVRAIVKGTLPLDETRLRARANFEVDAGVL